MEIRLIRKNMDLPKINRWLAFKVEANELPGHTYCAIVDGDIIAIAGFRLMEGPLCFIDSMATNQKVDGKLRNEALDELTKAMLKMAKALGFKKIFATTVHDCIIKRAEKHGFRVLNQTVIGREL